MTYDELIKEIKSNTETSENEMAIISAVDAYLSASNGAKPLVSGALPQVDQSLLDEAVSDVITISTLNEYSVAKKLISEQFLVINKEDLSGNDR